MIDPDTLAALLVDHRKYHSPLQISRFIIEKNSSGTVYGGYKQSLRELSGRVGSLRVNMVELTRTREEVRELRQRAGQKNLFGDADVGAQCDLALAEAKLDDLNLTVRETWRELQSFYEHAKTLRASLPDELDEELRHNLDVDMWKNEAIRRVNLDLRVDKKMQAETVRLLDALPREERQEVMDGMKKGELPVSELFLEALSPDNGLPEAEVRKLLGC